ncbi:MAG: hypothetical protein CVT98_04800 [Bacteroidetes bacterium HGW-Bacteroidetes-15]|jgi:hypothetical protein|nr:MAG: hypothetical protein CVT98_04800 [Bacteroidetes bacterium HGW-Bacteroidetes-15]PKP43988.1 MAG: hypothetical protein CVT96_03465 [Bacteroidetes bacterium HGW-Bacteroidetes-13]
MKVVLEIPDSKADFGLKVLRSLDFIKHVKPMTIEKITLWEDLREASKDVKLHKQGKLKLKTAIDLLDEL